MQTAVTPVGNTLVPIRADGPNLSTQNIFWITEESRYLNSKMTCVKTNKSHIEVKRDVYYLLSEAGEIINREWGKGIDETQPESEGICHLLIKYYGYELCEYSDSAIEIDSAWVWEAEDPDIPARDKNWLKWLNLTHFRFGLYSELTALIRHDINVSRMDQYPWSDVHQSVTGWDCGDYIIEVPFCRFNSQSEAEEFGRSCFALQTNEQRPSLFRLFYGDGEQDCLRKDEVTVFRKPSPFSEVNPDDRAVWEVAELSAEDIPDLEINGPLYCEGREIKGGADHAN